MKSIPARIETLKKEMEATLPNGGILIELTDQYSAISATTIAHGTTCFRTKAEALDALKDCKSIWEIKSRKDANI